jgi:hypothetical protein
MLAEFALTPSVFEEEAQVDLDLWRDQLRDLGSRMFPVVSAWPVMVSDLHAGSWNELAKQTVKSIKDQKARILCEGILNNAAKVLVPRPGIADWPDDAVAWGQEAIDSYAVEPIERIVACKPSFDVLTKKCNFIRCITEVPDAGFWKDISADQSPPMKILDQAATLRKLCVHSEFLSLLTSQIYGGSDDETDFAIELIRSAFRRPPGFPKPEIEVHTDAFESNPKAPDYAIKLTKLVNAVSQRIKPVIPGGEKVRLVIWPKLLDRLVIAGTYTEAATGVMQRSPRWGISMSHIARKPDEKIADFYTEWKLLKRDSLGRWFDRYCKGGVTGFCDAQDIHP